MSLLRIGPRLFVTGWLSSRLDTETEREWEKSLSDKNKFPSYEQLKTFLSNYAIMIDDLKHMKTTKNEEFIVTKRSNVRSTAVNTVTAPISKYLKYYLCKAPHYLPLCERFQSKTPEQRYEIVKANKLCYGCFSSKHSMDTCNHKCKICECKRHNLLNRHLDSANINVNARNCENDRMKIDDSNVM